MLKVIKNAPDKVNEAILEVVAARAKWELVNEADKESRQEVLQSANFIKEETGDRITDHTDDFMMSEQDFEKYCALVYKRNCEKGFDSGSAGTTFWDIHKAVYTAEEKLIDAITENIPQYTKEIIETVKLNSSIREKFLNVVGL